MLEQMTPTSSLTNAPDGGQRYAEASRQNATHAWPGLSAQHGRADDADGAGTQFGSSMTTTSRRSAFGDHIGHVDIRVTQKQMFRIHARWNITRMQHPCLGWNWFAKQIKREPMDINKTARTLQLNQSVSCPSCGPPPQPASIRVLANPAEQPLFNRTTSKPTCPFRYSRHGMRIIS